MRSTPRSLHRAIPTQLSAAIALAALALPARDARACSAPLCFGGELRPRGTVPANLGKLAWRPYLGWSNNLADVPATELAWVASDGERVPVTLEVPEDLGAGGVLYVVPSQPLREGQTYELEQPSFCTGEPGPRPNLGPVTAGPAAALPATLGLLTVSTATVGAGTSVGWVEVPNGASCSTLIRAASVLVRVDLSAEAEPWRDALLYQTIVDGQPWQPRQTINHDVRLGESRVGPGVDQIYAPCEPISGDAFPVLALGAHEVKLRATIPGVDGTLETPPLQITLSCATGGGDDAGPSTGDGGSASAPDASAPAAADAGVGLAVEEQGSSACTCLGVPSHQRPLGLILALGVARLVRRRRASHA